MIYPCGCACGCEQGYDYQPSSLCSECGNGEHQGSEIVQVVR